MEVKIKQRTSWLDVVNAARFTQHKEDLPIGQEPSSLWKYKVLMAEHSPVRELEYQIDLLGIPYAVAMHLVRYNAGVGKYVATSRPDITGKKITRHEQRKDDPTDVRLICNAQAIMYISRQRLCGKAEIDTRTIWQIVILHLAQIDRELADMCVPQCIRFGFCPEMKCCGMVCKNNFPDLRKQYISFARCAKPKLEM